jgi:hypothetical protein
MKIKKFNEMITEKIHIGRQNIINESLPPHDPNIGYYDMSNGNMETLCNLLNEKDVKYDYDADRNYLIIEVDVVDMFDGKTAKLAELINNSEGNYVEFSKAFTQYYDDPNDVVLIRRKVYKDTAPPGAYH